MSGLESLNLTQDSAKYSHALVTRELCCSSADHAILPEDIPETRKQWKQTPPGTRLNILAKAKLSNDSLICLEEIHRMFVTVNSAGFSLVYYFFYRCCSVCDENQHFEAVGKPEKHGQPVPAATALSCSSERPLSGHCCFQ